MTAIAPARPASASVAAARELTARCGTPHPASWRAGAGSGWSSTTTAGTPDWLSSSTKRRPHTITWPRQSAYPPVTRASSRFSMTRMIRLRARQPGVPAEPQRIVLQLHEAADALERLLILQPAVPQLP